MAASITAARFYEAPPPGMEKARFLRFISPDMSVSTFEKSPDNRQLHYLHSHGGYEFMIPLTPMPFMQVGGGTYLGEVGWVYCAAPGRTHGFKYDAGDISYDRVEIRSEFFEPILREKGGGSTFAASPFRCTEELRIFLESFKREAGKDGPGLSKLYHLASLICDEIIDGGMGLSVVPEQGVYQRGLRASAEYMNENYNTVISLDALARRAGFSRNYFTTSFRNMYGETPLAYLTKLRVSKAKQLLETTEDSVRDIARGCGYSKPNSFTQAFHTATGLNPMEYRRIMRTARRMY